MYLNASSEKCIILATETSKDPVLVALKNQIIKGWPKQRNEFPESLNNFLELQRCIIHIRWIDTNGKSHCSTRTVSRGILTQLHEDHFGIDHTKMRAHDSVNWPIISKDIENLIKTCNTCQENSRRNTKDPVIPREIPITLWFTLEMNLFTLDGYPFLLVVDVASRFPVL